MVRHVGALSAWTAWLPLFPAPGGSSVLPCCDYSIALLTVLFNAQNSQNSTVNIVNIDTVNRVDIVV